MIKKIIINTWEKYGPPEKENNRKELKPYLWSIIVFLLFVTFKKQLYDATSNIVLPLFENSSNWSLNCLFLVCIILLSYYAYLWEKTNKVMSNKYWATLLCTTLVYGYFRIVDDTYNFLGITIYGNCCFVYFDTLFIWDAAAILIAWIINKRRKKDKNNNESQASYLSDEAIEEDKDDELNSTTYIEKVSSYIIDTINDFNHFSFGVVGKWGEGKSSFVNLLIKKFEKDSSNLIIIKYNPRQSADEKQISKDLLEKIGGTLESKHSSMSSLINDYADALKIGEELNPIFKCLRMVSWRDVNTSKKMIEDVLSYLKIKVLIFIDDLDRLTASEIIEVLKLIDKNAAFKNVYFITAFDKSYINKVLNAYFRLSCKEDFSDKYFNVEINVPVQSPLNISNYIQKQFFNYLNRNKIEQCDFNDLIKREFNVIQEYLPTIRDIKRFYNLFTFEYTSVRQDVKFRDFFFVTLIKYKYREEYACLMRKKYINNLGKYSIKDNIYYLKAELFDKDKQPNKSAPKCMPLLKSLFPTEDTKSEWNAKRPCSIFNETSFDVYFLNYTNGGLFQKDMQTLYDGTITDAITKIDQWKDTENVKIIESFLLMPDILTFTSKENLSRYIQLLFYCYYKMGNLNYATWINRFMRIDEMNNIEKTYKFNNETYRKFMRRLISDLENVNIEPIWFYFLETLRYMIHEAQVQSDYILTKEDFYNICKEIFDKYLSQIGKDDWDATQMFSFAKIPGLDGSMTSEEIISSLRDSMLNNPALYAKKIICHVSSFESIVLRFNFELMWDNIFNPRETFQQFVTALDLSDADSVTKELVSKFWNQIKEDTNNQIIYNDTRKEIAKFDYKEYLKLIEEKSNSTNNKV